MNKLIKSLFTVKCQKSDVKCSLRGFTPLEITRNNKHQAKSHKFLTGFTLIELLVVIAIIGLLATIVTVSVNSARAKSRDAKRKSELRQIQTALELYYDKYNTYPVSTPVCNPGQNEHGDPWCRDTTNNNGLTPILNWIPGLNEFMSNMPHNPKPYASGASWPYHYYSPSTNQYWLMVGLENTQDKDTCGGGAVYTWFDGTNTCGWWGSNLYVRSVK